MSIILNVAPEDLKQKANDISAEMKQIEGMLKNMDDIILGTKRYWEGDVSNAHQNHYKTIKDNICKIMKKLEKYPEDLLRMAKLHDEAEEVDTRFASKLPSDAIQ